MAERPILFSAPMMRAILNGTKTQTRRVVKVKCCGVYVAAVTTSDVPNIGDCPYGVPGDRLWVKETFALYGDGEVVYRADAKGFDPKSAQIIGGRWRPSIHMPRRVSRITLEITDVRVERLHQISEEDAIAEGITRGENGWYQPMSCSNARWAYKELWNQINGLGSWDANPWVWVVSFRRVEP